MLPKMIVPSVVHVPPRKFATSHTTTGGAVPVTFKLLSPAQRPVQITRDLAGFWKSSYLEVRKEMRGRYPAIGPRVFAAPTAAVIGLVTIMEDASIWFGAVLRGDEMEVRIGRRSNIQDSATLITLYRYALGRYRK